MIYFFSKGIFKTKRNRKWPKLAKNRRGGVGPYSYRLAASFAVAVVVIGAALTANAGDIYWNGAHGSVAEPLDINDSQYWSGTPAWDNNMRFSDASGQTTYLTNTLGLAGWVCDIIDFK